MTMTKKDFEVLAQALSVARPSAVPRTYGDAPDATAPHGQIMAAIQWMTTIDTLVARLQNQYPMFHPGRFTDACYA